MSNPLPLLTTAREVTLHDARERLAAGAAAAVCRRRRLDVEAERARELDAAVGQLRPALQAHVNRDVSNRRSRIGLPQIIASDETYMVVHVHVLNLMLHHFIKHSHVRATESF